MLGSGILKGLGVTAKNFVGSYHDPARMVTQEYPDTPAQLPEAYRNFPFLVTENATDPMGTLRCVACQICEKECPPQCIYIEKSKDKKPLADICIVALPLPDNIGSAGTSSDIEAHEKATGNKVGEQGPL